MTRNTAQWASLDVRFPLDDSDEPRNVLARFQLTDAPGWTWVVEIGPTGLVQRFTVEPNEGTETPAGGVTTRVLRQVPLGAWTNYVKQLVSDGARASANEPRAGMPEGFLEAVAGFTSRPGRRGRDDLGYAQVAAAYVARLEDTTDRTPVESLAASLHLSPSQVRNVLYQARRRDLLTKSPPGRPGGTLTDKARQLLKEASDGEH